MCILVDRWESVVAQLGAVAAAALFEGMLDALGYFTPGVEILEPGRCLMPTLGPTRYHGGEDALVAEVSGRLAPLLDRSGVGGVTLGLSVAGGPRTALIAAAEAVRRHRATAGATDGVTCAVLVVDVGGDAGFLAPLSIRHLGRLLDDGTEDLLRRLGLVSIGSFAGLDSGDVLARFGPDVLEVHHMANGREHEPSRPRIPEVPVQVAHTMEPPLELVDQIAFVARTLAQDLMDGLSPNGLTADRIVIVAENEAGGRSERAWCTNRGLTVQTIAQRVRWQMEGWAALGGEHSGHAGPTGHVGPTGQAERSGWRGGVCLLQIQAEDVHPRRGEQIGFWGEVHEHDRFVMNGIDRIRGTFGADSVRVPRPRGGRSPGDAYRLMDVDSTWTPPHDREPWPGSIPPPSPARVWVPAVAAGVVDHEGSHVGVSGRGVITSTPALVSIDGGPWFQIESWAGPWCVDERWWDPLAHRRKARLQVVIRHGDVDGCRHRSRRSTDEPAAMPPMSPVSSMSALTPPVTSPQTTSMPAAGPLTAHLLTLEAGQWWVEATYD